MVASNDPVNGHWIESTFITMVTYKAIVELLVQIWEEERSLLNSVALGQKSVTPGQVTHLFHTPACICLMHHWSHRTQTFTCNAPHIILSHLHRPLPPFFFSVWINLITLLCIYGCDSLRFQINGTNVCTRFTGVLWMVCSIFSKEMSLVLFSHLMIFNISMFVFVPKYLKIFFFPHCVKLQYLPTHIFY